MKLVNTKNWAVILLMVIITITAVTSVSAERFVQFDAFEGIIQPDGTLQATTTPVTNFNVAGFVCADPNCDDYNSPMYDGNVITSTDGSVILSYPTFLEPFGYGQIFYQPGGEYIPYAISADFRGTNANDPEGPYPIYLSKMEVCRSPIDSFIVINDAAPNEPIQFEVLTSLDATVWSAIQFGGPVGFQAPQTPESYLIDTTVQLVIRDNLGNVVETLDQDLVLPYSGAQRVFFEWTPTELGGYTATITTGVPDAKCLSDAPASASKDFSVISSETTEACYALANSLNVQPLNQVAGVPTTIGVESIANLYDEFGNLQSIAHELAYTVEKTGFSDAFTTTIPAQGNVDQYTTTTTQYVFPESGLYTVTVDASPLNCPYFDEASDTVTVEYLVIEGNNTNENTAPTLNAGDIFVDENAGTLNNIYNLEDFAFDPDQPANTLQYTIVSQTNPDLVTCTIDNNNYLDCTVADGVFGQSVVEIRVTDNQGAFGTDLVTFTVNNIAQCRDGIDNDGDGLVDLDDPGCTNELDDDESDDPADPQCSDGIDNDNDGFIDYPADLSCTSPDDNDELNPTQQCKDGLDNDGDGLIDDADPACSGTQDDSELGTVFIDQVTLDGVTLNENTAYTILRGDRFSITDLVADDAFTQLSLDVNLIGTGVELQTLVSIIPGTSMVSQTIAIPQTVAPGTYDLRYYLVNSFFSSLLDDKSFTVTILPRCQDGVDNDGDGLTDLDDPGCENPDDDSESDDGFLTCTDTDGGNVPSILGLTTLTEDSNIIEQQQDACLDSSTLIEYFCTADGIGSQTVTCAHGCSAGACLEAPTQCNDGLDNDGDGLIDLDDPGCENRADNDESDPEDELRGDNVKLTRIFVANPMVFQDGYGYAEIVLGLDNSGDNDYEHTNIQVFIPELGVMGAAGPFSLDDGDRKSVSVFVPVYEQVAPGTYTLRIHVRSEFTSRIKHRFFDVE